MKTPITKASSYIKETKGIELKNLTRFLNVTINKKNIGEAVVGLHNQELYIIHKKVLGYKVWSFKLEIDAIEEFQSLDLFKYLLNNKTIILQLKKYRISFIDPIEGDFAQLMKTFNFTNDLPSQKSLKYIKNYYRFKKIVSLTKWSAIIVGAPLGGHIIFDITKDYLEEKLNNSMQIVVEEKTKNMPNEIVDAFFNKLNPFA